MGLNLSRGDAIKYYSSDRITQIVGNGLVCLIDEKTQSESSVKAIEATCNESFSSVSVGRERVESIFDDENTQSDSSVNVIEANAESSTSDDSGREDDVSESESKFGIFVSNVLLTSTSS